MGKLEKRLAELKKEPEKPSKYDLDQEKLIKRQEEFSKGQERLVTGLNVLVEELQSSIEQITTFNMQVDSALNHIANAVSGIKLDIDLSEVYDGISKVDSAISNIKPADLTKLESAVKRIKPTDISRVSNKLDALLTAVQNIEIPNIDLTPLINEMALLRSGPKTVEFKVISNAHGFPTAVIAKEDGPTIN